MTEIRQEYLVLCDYSDNPTTYNESIDIKDPQMRYEWAIDNLGAITPQTPEHHIIILTIEDDEYVTLTYLDEEYQIIAADKNGLRGSRKARWGYIRTWKNNQN